METQEPAQMSLVIEYFQNDDILIYWPWYSSNYC